MIAGHQKLAPIDLTIPNSTAVDGASVHPLEVFEINDCDFPDNFFSSELDIIKNEERRGPARTVVPSSSTASSITSPLNQHFAEAINLDSDSIHFSSPFVPRLSSPQIAKNIQGEEEMSKKAEIIPEHPKTSSIALDANSSRNPKLFLNADSSNELIISKTPLALDADSSNNCDVSKTSIALDADYCISRNPKMASDADNNWNPKMPLALNADSRNSKTPIALDADYCNNKTPIPLSPPISCEFNGTNFMHPLILPFVAGLHDKPEKEITPLFMQPTVESSSQESEEDLMKRLNAERSRLSMAIVDLMEQIENDDDLHANLTDQLVRLRQEKREIDLAIGQIRVKGRKDDRVGDAAAAMTAPIAAEDANLQYWSRLYFPWSRNIQKAMKQ